MEQLLEVLKRAVPNANWEAEGALVDDGIIDSIDIVSAISEIMDEYDVEIGAEDMEPENFNSVEAIYNLIKRLEEE